MTRGGLYLYILDYTPALGPHIKFSFEDRGSQFDRVNWPYSHAFVSFQWRLTVMGETPRTSAVSVVERPPKYRSSTIFALTGSILASSLRVSSRAMGSVLSSSDLSISSLRVSIWNSPPRF